MSACPQCGHEHGGEAPVFNVPVPQVTVEAPDVTVNVPPPSTMSEGTRAYLTDLEGDADPAIVRIAQSKFSDHDGKKLLAYLLTRLHFFSPELLNARQVALRNLGGILLNLIGFQRFDRAIEAMVGSAVNYVRRREGTQ